MGIHQSLLQYNESLTCHIFWDMLENLQGIALSVYVVYRRSKARKRRERKGSPSAVETAGDTTLAGGAETPDSGVGHDDIVEV